MTYKVVVSIIMFNDNDGNQYAGFSTDGLNYALT